MTAGKDIPTYEARGAEVFATFRGRTIRYCVMPCASDAAIFAAAAGLTADEARLIVAAPALLEALKWLSSAAVDDHECAYCDLLDEDEEGNDAHQEDCLILVADAAIEAATARRP